MIRSKQSRRAETAVPKEHRQPRKLLNPESGEATTSVFFQNGIERNMKNILSEQNSFIFSRKEL